MLNIDVVPIGITENENVDPPLAEVGVIIPLLVEDVVKSEARPVVAPILSRTVIVHLIATPTRAGIILVHVSVDAVVGTPIIVALKVPFVIKTPPIETFTE